MNDEFDPSYSMALKLWWAMIWRTIPLALVGAGVIGFVLGLISGVLGIPLSTYASGTIGLAWGGFASVWIIKRLMTKGFGIYRLAILEKTIC